MSFDAPPIDSTLPLSKELKRLGLTHAGNALSALSRGDIHETRRVLKRLRAVLCLAIGDHTASKADKELRDIGRMLSTSRDLEVSRALLPTLTGHLTQGEQQHLETVLEPNNKRGSAIRKALPILHDVCHTLHEWQPDTDWSTLSHTMTQSYRQAVRRLKKCREHVEAARKSSALSRPLHEMRKELKRLGHQLHLLPLGNAPHPSPEPSWLERAKAEVRRVSELLGKEHDLHVLQESLGKHARPALLALKPRRAVLQNEAIECASQFLRSKPSAFCRKLEEHLAQLVSCLGSSLR